MMDKPFLDYRWPLLTVLGIIVFVLTYCLGGISGGAGESVLSTLARVQAAIFAIVFSVVILGVQLSASRYSPRLASTFKSDSAYRLTVGIFGISIGFCIAGLYAIDLVSETAFMGMVVFASIFAVGAFWTLYDFVSDTLEKTTPEGILKEIKNEMTPESIIEDAYAKADDSGNRDPFLTLVNIIFSTISEGDRDAASYGLSILSGRVNDLLEHAPEEEFEEEEPVDECLEDLCVDRVPNISQETVDMGLTQIGVETVEASKSIGEKAAEQELDRVVEHAVRGLSNIVNELGYGMNEERVRTKAIGFGSDILKTAVDNNVWLGAARGSRLLGWLSAASLRDRTEGYNRGYTSLLILCFPKLVGTAVDSEEDIEEHLSSEWLRGFLLDDFEPVELMVTSCYGSMAELTSAAIRYEIRAEEGAVNWEHVAHGWTEGFESLYEAEVRSASKLWLGTILYLEYLSFVSPEGVMEGFDPRAVMLADSDLGLETKDEILQGEIEIKSRVDHLPGTFDPVKTPLTGYHRPPISNPEVDFEEWLQEQRFRLGMDNRFGSINGDTSEE